VQLIGRVGKVYDVTEFLDGEPWLVTYLETYAYSPCHFQTTRVRLLVLYPPFMLILELDIKEEVRLS
jgi:hypothetical protein